MLQYQPLYQELWNKKWMYLILILFGILFFIIDFCNHYYFRTPALDYGTYNFAFYDLAHFRISECPTYIFSSNLHSSFIQDHLSFTMFVFIPIYWIFGWITGTYTLLYLQTVLILFGGWAVFKLIELKTTLIALPILAILQYFILFGRWTALTLDCNLAIMAASLVPVFLYFFEIKKFAIASTVFIFILISREDMALWTIFIGFFLFLTHYKVKPFRIGALIIIVTSLIYFIVAFKVLIPFFESPYKKFDLFNYSSLGTNPSIALIFIIKHPLKTLWMIFVNQSGDPSNNYIKFEFYYVYFISGGFLLFLYPKYLILFIPLLAKKMLNDDPTRWSTELYYSIEFVSILPIAIFLILSEFKNQYLKYMLAITVFSLTLLITIIKLKGFDRKRDWWGDSKYAFYKSTMYKAGFDEIKVYRYLELIPPNAKVSLCSPILPHLAFRKKAYLFPRVDDAEYIAVFDSSYYPLTKDQFNKEINKYKSDNKWGVIVDDPPLLILKNNNRID